MHNVLLILCDTFDWSDFPVYVDTVEAARRMAESPGSMTKTMEVYYLKEPLEAQINKHRCFNYGPDETVTA